MLQDTLDSSDARLGAVFLQNLFADVPLSGTLFRFPHYPSLGESSKPCSGFQHLEINLEDEEPQDL